MNVLATMAVLVGCFLTGDTIAREMEWIRVADDKRSFVFETSGRRFVPWGFNYDHDRDGVLIEDYWNLRWKTIEEDFTEMKTLGANVVRVHLQFGRFMEAADKPNRQALDQLRRVVELSETVGVYLDLTGLGCYHKQDVPKWYDELSEEQRWNAQARFWKAVAETCSASPAIFCYDLMNEPVVPGGKNKRDDWLAGAFAGNHFVQFIALETKGRPRHEIARRWIGQLADAIRKQDPRHLVTVGLVPWSLDRPGLTSGFIPEMIADDLDFIAMHIYPESRKIDDAIATLEGFSIGKPVVIEEMFPLRCTATELGRFIDGSREHATGWIGFYWGKTPDEYRQSDMIGDAIVLKWLELFQEKVPMTGH